MQLADQVTLVTGARRASNLVMRWGCSSRAFERSDSRGGQQFQFTYVTFSQLMQLLENNKFDTRLR